ncbi:hypothetical protein LguiA_012678 [Lonicera macranthoides]
MYKARLQEFCQKKRWALPRYTCVKDGPDHNPQFRASVVVNGFTFDMATVCKSSKEARNEAAKLAFLHFTSDGNNSNARGAKVDETQKNADTNSNASGVIVDDAYVVGGKQIEEAHQRDDIPSNASTVIANSQSQYKMILQTYAQRKSLGLPAYSNKREGPPHDLRFIAAVTVGGESFESPTFCKNLKEAEHLAAQVALLSLSLDTSQQNESQYCKNLLQELAQNEGFMFPTYKTVKSGEAHRPTFFSIVEIEGESFHGKAAKSKKLAELNAAQAAYTALMERKSNRTGDFTSQVSSQNEALKVTHSSSLIKSGPSLDSSQAMKYEEQAKENEDVKPESYLLCNRVRVYPRVPDMEFPKGTVVLPISDDNWVAVSLEFPNEI